MRVNPELRVAFMKALADLGDTSVETKAHVVRRLWRSGDPETRQTARVLLKMFKAGKRGRPSAREQHIEIAWQVLDETARLRALGKSKHGVYGIVGKRIGKSGDWVGDIYRDFEQAALDAKVKALAAEPKVRAIAAFLGNAARWK